MTPRKPRATLRLRSPEQFDALLASPARAELLEALQVAGRPLAIADLARRVGRKPSALYHHVRKLADAGIVERAGTAKSGPRDQALWRPTARRVRVDYQPGDPDVVDAIQRGGAAVLRMAERDFRRCVAAASARGAGLPKALDTTRDKAWLTARDLAELHRRLEGLRGFLRTRSRPGRGRLVALTITAAELPLSKER
jgi:DNA-binding transcriptional ArsR family regulator